MVFIKMFWQKVDFQIFFILSSHKHWNQFPTNNFYIPPQTLDYKNGFMKPVVPVSVGKGGEPIHFNQISQNELDELAKFQPTLTYGQAKQVGMKNMGGVLFILFYENISNSNLTISGMKHPVIATYSSSW